MKDEHKRRDNQRSRILLPMKLCLPVRRCKQAALQNRPTEKNVNSI